MGGDPGVELEEAVAEYEQTVLRALEAARFMALASLEALTG
jgi:hypothetical protein